MADATVALRQDANPDRLIDNETFEVNGQTVYRQRVSTGDVDPAGATLTTAATTDIVTPAAGKKLRLRWYYIQADPDNGSKVKVTVKVGTKQVFEGVFEAGSQMARGTRILGVADAKLTVTLDAAQTIYFNAETEEPA